MFERYTERARRSLYYAGQTVSEYGSMTVGTEHVLLGILREDSNIIGHFLPSKTNDEIRAEVEKGIVVKAKIPTHVDIPLSEESEWIILTYAVEEADTL